MAYQFIFFDYETFSLQNLKEVGLDNYVKHESTGISMCGWACDREDIEVWLPHLGPPPRKLIDNLRDPNVIKIAWHSMFEYNITKRKLSAYVDGGIDVPLAQYRDPIILAHNLSLPGKLDTVASILKMKEQKDPRGDELKKMFCMPVSKGGEQTLFGTSPVLFRDHISHPKEFAEYVEYCRQDVRAERDLWYRLSAIPFPEWDWQGWVIDQMINEFGMPGRRDLAEKGLRLALKFITYQRALLESKIGMKPNKGAAGISDAQMKAWASERGYPLNSIRANTVKAEIANPNTTMTAECKEAFQIRASARKSSYTKLEKFLALLSPDDRLRFQFSYMGAARTGRWKSGGKEEESNSMQVQNMARGEKYVKKNLMRALELLDAEDYDGIVREFTQTKNPKDSVTVVELVITLLRSLFQAKPGHKLIVADKNAIENRMLGWAAGCKAILDVFRTCNDCGELIAEPPVPFLCPKCGGKKSRDPYLAFGTKLYDKSYDEMWKAYAGGYDEDRQNSKPPVLGAGYGLSGGEMFVNEYGDEVRGGLWGYALTVCGVDMPKDLAHKAVKIFRDSYPEVVQFWTDLEEAFKQVLKRGGRINVGEVTWNRQEHEWVEHPTKGKGCVIGFTRKKIEGSGWMICMHLPSGRALHYLNATIEEEQKVSKRTGKPYTSYQIMYDGVEHSATQDAAGATKKKQHKWGRVKTYGGKLCLTGETPVITSRGIVRLDQISVDDQVWDGVEWTNHGGLLYNGIRETQTWMGLTGTSDHPIRGGSEWHELGKTNNLDGLCSLLTGLASALRLWCSLNRESLAVHGCDVTADKFSMSQPPHCVETMSMRVHPADARKAELLELKDSDITSSLTESCGKRGYANSQTFSLDATTLNAEPTPTTVGEELSVTSLGEEVEVSGLNTQSLFRDGIIQLWTLIESTTMGIMNREISALFLAEKIALIVAQLSGLVGMEKNFHMRSFASDILRSGAKTLSTIILNVNVPSLGVSPDTTKQRVYDLQNCGSRRQFMVMTDGGPVMAHNCENAIQAMSRDDLVNSIIIAFEMGFHIWGLFHDELATEEETDVLGELRLEDLIWCMTRVPIWAPGLLLGAEGYESQVYHK